MKLSIIKISIWSIFFSVLTITNASALSLNIAGDGSLLGAYDVGVNGVLYDVLFVDGTAEDLFYDAGTGLWDNTFNTMDDATAASNALLNLVFLGVYDSNPGLTNGIDNDFGGIIHTIYNWRNPTGIPNSYVYDSIAAQNHQLEANDYLRSLSNTWTTDTTGRSMEVHAVWSESSTSAVPEPATMILFGTGVAGLLGSRLRKKK